MRVKSEMPQGDAKFASFSSHVVFDNIQQKYSYKEDLLCEYHLNGYEAQEGDRVCIFRLGWMKCMDYLMFEWAPVGYGRTPTNSVCFYKHRLPCGSSDLYQFVYIADGNVVFAASQPFLFVENLSFNTSPSSLTFADMHEENQRLKKENELLRDALQLVIVQNKECGYAGKIEALWKELSGLTVRVAEIEANARTTSECDLDCEIVELEELESFPSFPLRK